MRISSLFYCVGILTILSCSVQRADPDGESWTFVSMPDFLNVDCDYPQKGWEGALSSILDSLKKENPAFLLVAGDLVMGHWDSAGWNNRDTIGKYSERYYTAWKNRMNEHGLKYYTSIGDHEIGDNPWNEEAKFEAVKYYKKAFAKHMRMPENGPENNKGTAFWWRHKNVIFISVDVFEEGKSNQGNIKAGVTGTQLAWLREILASNSDVAHKIVLGHAPALGPVRKWSSSGLMINEGRESEFWQTMKEFNVDAYLCGEVHAITCTEKDSIMQIAHGGLIGYNTRANYLVVKVFDDKLQMEIKEIDMLPSGTHLWQKGDNRPLEHVNIEPGSYWRTVGHLTIDKTSESKQFKNRTGYFLKKYATSAEHAVPIFRKDDHRGLPTALVKIWMEE